jgi:phage/plasmid-associated DNA primase
MDPELRDLLRNTVADQSAKTCTHVSTYGPSAKWSVRDDAKSAFWIGYCDLVDRKLNGTDTIAPEPLANLCLAEAPSSVMPLISKLTFRFHADDGQMDSWEPFDDHFVHTLCHVYQTVLSEYFVLPTDSQLEMVVVVLESAKHWMEDDVTTGQKFMILEMRIQFPFARMDSLLQSTLIRPRVITMLRNMNALGKLQRQPIGDWEKIISDKSSTEPLIMYGSCETMGRPKLVMTHIWRTITSQMLEEGEPPEELSIEDTFTPLNHTDVQTKIMDPNIFTDDIPLEHWLPMFFSYDFYPAVLLVKNSVGEDVQRITQQNRNNNVYDGPILRNRTRTDEDTDDALSEVSERLVPMISKQRYLRETLWLDIGRALYNCNGGTDNGLLSWTRHTEKSVAGLTPPSYMTRDVSIADTCRNLYYTFTGSPISLKTLAWYAKEDAPEKYKTWHKEWCHASMEIALSALHSDVAQALYRVYWLDYAYCPVGTGKWFKFKSHRWTEAKQAIELRKYISTDFVRRFELSRIALARQIHESNDEAFRTNAELALKKINTLIGKLKTVPYKSSLIQEATEYFVDENFLKHLDNNPDLTGVTNGVIEVDGHHALYRAAKPEDYVSMCTNIPYHEHYSMEHPLVKECMKWLNQVFTDRALLHHFLKFASSCLKGRNSDKMFGVWSGDGDNSKSMIVKLFEATLNSYCIKFPVSLLSEKAMNSSGPTPQLARAKSTRIAFLDEPEDDVAMHKGTIKRYTGGDSFFARKLHDDGNDVQATFKMILMCNKVPLIANADRAVKNRTKIFPFMSNWVDSPPATEEEQMAQRKFKKDPRFEQRIPVLAPAFLWLMAHYFPRYCTEGLTDPVIVKETTETYWRDNDIYAQFAGDMIKEVFTEKGDRDPTARATLAEIYTEFKVWFKDTFPQMKIPERPIVRAELCSRWGKMLGNAWHGIRILANDGGGDLSSSLMGPKVEKENKGTGPTLRVQNKADLMPKQHEALPPALAAAGGSDVTPAIRRLI